MKFLKVISVIVISSFIFSCAGKDKDEPKEVASAEAMYNDAIDNLEHHRYTKSVELLEDLERTYPYSKWAVKGQIIGAYANYRDSEYDKAIASADRFIKLHPGNTDVPYAHYLKALSYYDQISNVDRDQSYTAYTKTALQEVIARFPDSKYAQDALIKLDLVNDHLAGKEVTVGRFYLKQGNYSAAINRFQVVLDEFQTTSHVEEALHRLVEANLALGVTDEAKRYAAVLGYNYPGSKWYKYSYKLIEGKKYTELTEEEKKGKWYDFASWKDLELPKVRLPFTGNGDDKSEEYIDEIQATTNDIRDVVQKDTENFAIPDQTKEDMAKSEKAKEAEEKKSPDTKKTENRLVKWFKSLKLPFSKDKDATDE